MCQATLCLPEYSLNKSYFPYEKNTFVCLSLLYFTELSTATVDEPLGQDLCQYAHQQNELSNTILCNLYFPASWLKYHQCWELKFCQSVNSFNYSSSCIKQETEADSPFHQEQFLTSSNSSDSGACGKDVEGPCSTQNPLPESKHSTQLLAFFKWFAAIDSSHALWTNKVINLTVLERTAVINI